jgi:hypothetical protein
MQRVQRARRVRTFLLPCAALAATALGQAEPRRSEAKQVGVWAEQPSDAEQAAAAFRHAVVPARSVRRAISRATSQLTWHKKLDDARRTATAAGRPIVWIQALGKLKGFA